MDFAEIPQLGEKIQGRPGKNLGEGQVHSLMAIFMGYF
jgi:hypothetical protein